KVGNEPKVKNGKKRERDPSKGGSNAASPAVVATYAGTHTAPAGTYSTSINPGAPNITVNQSQKALARVAVGKGIRHGYVPRQAVQKSDAAHAVGGSGPSSSVVAPSPVQVGLNALTNNYRNSLNELQNADQTEQTTGENESALVPATSGQTGATALSYVPGSLHRDDSR
ncbi:MAG: hypothetical protein SGARI_003308, partial [Bacillariaceae sp.]